MTKKVKALINLLLISAILLAGCSVLAPASEGEAPLRVEYTIWEGDYTALIAEEKGFFEKHGVDVELVYYDTFSTALPDLAANRIDVGLFAIGDMLAISRAADVKGVAVYDSGGTTKIVSKNSIWRITDLKGKKVGVNVGTTGEMVIREMLSSAGMSVSDVELVEVNPEDVPHRLSEDLDAGYVWAPYDKRAIDRGHIVLYPRGASETLFPDLIVFREDVTRERPEDVRAFLNAWFEALDYRLANPDECNQIIAEKTGQAVEDIIVSPQLKLYNRADNLKLFEKVDQSHETIYYSAKTNLDFLVMRGGLTQRPDLNVLLDPSFLQ